MKREERQSLKLWIKEGNYEDVIIPENKPFKEYNTLERRKAILNLIKEQGHLNLPTMKLAKEFDIHPLCIIKDKKVIAESLAKNIGKDAESEVWATHEKAISHLSRTDPAAAADESRKFYNWLFQTGKRVEHNKTPTLAVQVNNNFDFEGVVKRLEEFEDKETVITQVTEEPNDKS